MPFKRVVVTAPYFQFAGEKKKHTKYIMNSQGQMQGRNVVPKNRSDDTRTLRMVKPFDVNKDGDTKDKQDLHAGQIIGRSSSKQKPKRITILRHWSKGKVVKTHTRKND